MKIFTRFTHEKPTKTNFYQVETIVFLALKGFISVLFENSLFYINDINEDDFISMF